MANTMSKIWRELYGWKVTPPKHYGAFLGLAQVLPDGWQVRIFEHTARNWQEFVAVANGFIDAEKLIRARGLRVAPQGDGCMSMCDDHDFMAADLHDVPLAIRRMRYVSPAFMLRFHKVASRVFVHHMDDLAKPYPAEVWCA